MSARVENVYACIMLQQKPKNIILRTPIREDQLGIP